MDTHRSSRKEVKKKDKSITPKRSPKDKSKQDPRGTVDEYVKRFASAVHFHEQLIDQHEKTETKMETEQKRADALAEQNAAQAEALGSARTALSDKSDTIADLKNALESLRQESLKKDQHIADLTQNRDSLAGIASEKDLIIEEQQRSAHLTRCKADPTPMICGSHLHHRRVLPHANRIFGSIP